MRSAPRKSGVRRKGGTTGSRIRQAVGQSVRRSERGMNRENLGNQAATARRSRTRGSKTSAIAPGGRDRVSERNPSHNRLCLSAACEKPGRHFMSQRLCDEFVDGRHLSPVFFIGHEGDSPKSFSAGYLQRAPTDVGDISGRLCRGAVEPCWRCSPRTRWPDPIIWPE
jgi:hypothetical protein